MPIVDHARRLITCKLVYYGTGRAGKTTNLNYLHGSLPASQVGHFTSLSKRRDQTLFFDYMPVELGTVGAYRIRFQLYTVPGDSHNRGTRALVLQGADGVVFVVDSQQDRLFQNEASLQDLHENLAAHGISARELPFAFQYNKQDLDPEEILTVNTLSESLNFRMAPEFSASAITGVGVFESLRSVGLQVLQRLGASHIVDGRQSGAAA